jgi:cobalt/nickel transport system permease protein
MHIASGFLSPPVWGTMAAVSGAALAGSLVVAKRHLDERRIPLLGVMGAFVFAAQMVNFPILLVPGTSGHLGGGFLLAILLGAPLSMVAMTSVLVVQALVFQDGGVEALGANIFVMGVVPCLLGAAVRGLWLRPRPGRPADILTFACGALGLVVSATGVILMLWLSGALPSTVSLAKAVLVMDSVHLLIGMVEGVVTVLVVRFVLATRREAVLGTVEPLGAGEVAA